MFLLRTVSGLALAVGMALPVMSQTLSSLGGPAELPPASFTADQYVDSRGCVFIRAGYGGQETWVPRVSRDRQPLCGYEPSLPGGTAVASAPEPQEPEVEIELTVVDPGPTTPAPTPVPEPRPAAPVAAEAPTPAAPTPQRVVSCQGLPSGAAQYMQGSDVRCGPQQHHPSPGQQLRPAAAAAGIGAPEIQLAPVVIPEGYRQAWDDGRLNAARGLQYATPEGDAQMAALWSDTVPRVAVDPAADGLPVGQSSPVPAAVQIVTRASSTPEIAAEDGPQPTTVRIPAGHRYVEIARYSDRDNADAARLQLQRQGLATQLGGIERGGGIATFVVLAGPFDDPQALGRHLAMARGLGYGGATTR